MSSDCHLPSKFFVSHTSWTLFQILRTCFSAGATRSGFNVFVYLEPLTVGLTALYYTNLRFCRLKAGFVEEGGDGAVAFLRFHSSPRNHSSRRAKILRHRLHPKASSSCSASFTRSKPITSFCQAYLKTCVAADYTKYPTRQGSSDRG
jgi:hypothetical protein